MSTTDFASLSDREARRLAQTEFERPIALEAGAGTGKTTVLVARILSWSLGPGWEAAQRELDEPEAITHPSEPPTSEMVAARVLDGVLAITFTDAAAAQMANRVATALALLAANRGRAVTGFEADLLRPKATPEVLAARARALLSVLDHLAARTIHSHCWQLLVDHAMTLGLSPDLRVDADGRHLEEVIREVVEDEAKRAYAGADDHPLRQLALRLIDPRQIATALQDLLEDGLDAEALRRDPLGAEERRALQRRLLEAVVAADDLAAPLAVQRRARKAREVAETLQLTSQVVRAAAARPNLEQLAELLQQVRDLWPPDRLARLERWAAAEFTHSAVTALAGDQGALTEAAARLARVLRLVRRLDAHTLDAGRRALEPLMARVTQELRARGIATFNSLMSEAWRLLSERPAVASRERRRLRQLLVDEFQDTDRLQCELVRLLGLEGDASHRPGLFVVGDPKQSIYGWRDADLAAYEAFVQRLRSCGGVQARLTRNFRSVPAVLREVDRVIAPVMIPEAGLQPRFESLEPCHELRSAPGFARAGRAAVEYWVSWRLGDGDSEGAAANTRADDAARLEARAVARDVRELHDEEEVPWGEFGLLLRSTSRLEVFLEAFREAAVPFAVTSDKQYYRRREVIEAAALVRTVINPVDHLALVSFLRSASVGVPDAALLPLWQRGFPALATRLRGPSDEALRELRSVVRQVGSELPTDLPGLGGIRDWEASAVSALEGLACLRQSLAGDPADRFIERLRRRFLIEVTEAARFLGPYRLANLERFFRRLEQSLEERGGDIQAVLRALRRSVAEAEEAEQALPEGATRDALQVMTIHGAKGLEFRHVYLVQVHAGSARNHGPSVRGDRRWIPGQNAEYVLFNSPTPGFDEVEDREARIEAAERVRTLYVAMTRAIERLVVVGSWPDRPEPRASDKRHTFLDLLMSRTPLPESLARLVEECRSNSTAAIDAAATRWRFPDLESGTDPDRPRITRSEAALPGRRLLKRQSARLEACRAAACRHMQRRFSMTASDEVRHRSTRLFADDPDAAEDATPRSIALSAGEAFHRLLESWDLTADPVSELGRQRAIQQRWLAATLPDDLLAATTDRFDALVERFRISRLKQRFLELSEHVVARELPVVVPPSSAQDGAVGFVTGAIDLLHRDPGTGRLVIVDYKTDRVENEAEIGARAVSYHEQQTVYSLALQQALDLGQPPASQLWFIWPDRLWHNPPASR